MKKLLSANISLIGLFSISSILIILFLNTDKALSNHKLLQNQYHQSLNDRLALVNIIRKPIAEYNLSCIEKNNRLSLNTFTFQFECEKDILFKNPKKVTEKYHFVKEFSDELNLEPYRDQIIEISSLSELPQSSLDKPKIVMTKNDIDETLEHNFYGIILTNYLFDIKGKGKFYGYLFSTVDNDREERTFTKSPKVKENIERLKYMPYSKKIIANE